jgi:hypothetical protein
MSDVHQVELPRGLVASIVGVALFATDEQLQRHLSNEKDLRMPSEAIIGWDSRHRVQMRTSWSQVIACRDAYRKMNADERQRLAERLQEAVLRPLLSGPPPHDISGWGAAYSQEPPP